MPTYVYRCPECQVAIEMEQKITDGFRPLCKFCDGNPEMKREIQPTSFVLSGKGWAKDGYSK